jgi:signal transduction histidine kinase
MAALEALAKQISELFRINCRLLCPEGVLLEDNVKAAHLSRIAQEALNNAVKHGRARSIDIELFAQDGRVILQVTDDGVGFTQIPKEHKGMGLRTMKYRADLIGADFAIQTTQAPRRTKMVCSVRR